MSQRLRAQKLPAEGHVVSNVAELCYLLDDGELRICDMPTEITMCRPDYFCIPSEEHEINAHMIGNTGMVNIPKAMEQWTKANLLLKSLCEVHVMDAAPRLNDMVFAANGASTFVVDGVRTAIISSMVKQNRQGESRHYKKYLFRHGYDVRTLSSEVPFEGQGDILPHPHAGLMYGGYMLRWPKWSRTSKEAYAEVSAIFRVPVILLELVLKEFYHLDTAFCPLDNETVLYYPGAFSLESREMIEKAFPRRIEVTYDEAMTFVCNAVVVGHHVVLPRGADRVGSVLEEMGFAVHWVDMDQFLLAGGAAKCLTLNHYRR